jgi:hypothetical protein
MKPDQDPSLKISKARAKAALQMLADLEPVLNTPELKAELESSRGQSSGRCRRIKFRMPSPHRRFDI